MGSLHDVERPDFMNDNLTAYDLKNDDIEFTLTDIYQFLLFEGESPESKSELLDENYDILQKELMLSINHLQRSSVGKALKRIFNKEKKKNMASQTPSSSLEEDMKIMREDMDRLYQEKHAFKQIAENAK